MANPLVSPLMRWLGRLSFPRLFLLAAALFFLDLLIPDVIPLADEILLGLGTLLLSRWKKKPDSGKPPIEGQANRR
ncbi:DUF6116 family protein [Thermomonas fusca]|uniref:Uncharacterized protein n=1 Tax=Thermomonas fusca TaxID=215690 RepID=A0A5R9PCR0_9GAMM|nr:DUF6116 family protein [Thermomonas fusca]TLX21299.1 hypothetical protein E5S66_10145 [Thermomonas fusca]